MSTIFLQVPANVKIPRIVIRKNSEEPPSCNDDDDGEIDNDEVFVNGTEADHQRSKHSLKLVDSIKNRFYNTSTESLLPVEIPREDSEIRCAQWLSRLPYEALIPMLCPKSPKSPSLDVSPAASALNLLPPSPTIDNDSGINSPSCNSPTGDDLSDAEELHGTPLKGRCVDERKDKTFGPSFVIDDSISPEPRRRPNAFGRLRNPRPFRHVHNGCCCS